MLAQLNTDQSIAESRKPGEAEAISDPAGIAGLMVSTAILACLMLGIMIPVVFWILSGALGLVAIGCSIASRSNLRWWSLCFGIIGLIPTILFILVLSIPTLEKM